MDRLLGEHGIPLDTPAGRTEFAQRMEAMRMAESDPAGRNGFRSACHVGSEHFKRQMLEKMDAKLGEHHAGELHRESAEAKADQIIVDELSRQAWGQTDLEHRPKSHPIKLALAERLRKETTLSIKQIAARLHLGTSKSGNARLHQWMRHRPSDSNQPQLQI